VHGYINEFIISHRDIKIEIQMNISFWPHLNNVCFKMQIRTFNYKWTDQCGCIYAYRSCSHKFLAGHALSKILLHLGRVGHCKTWPWKSIWKVKVPLRVAFFVWTATIGKILTLDNLRKMNIIMME